MGHERIGFLPKTKQWQEIIKALEDYTGSPDAVREIISLAMRNLHRHYRDISSNESLREAIRFMSSLCFSAKSDNQIEYLSNRGINVGGELSIYGLVNSIGSYGQSVKLLDEQKMAKDALMHSLIEYQQRHETHQVSFDGVETGGIWSRIGNGAAFCEMARSFIAAFVDRHLRYFLDRAAASSLSDYSQIASFRNELSKQTGAIRKHSSEISKLVESYSAGWFGKYSSSSEPSNSQIDLFLSKTFGKVREEFRRENSEA